MPPSDSATARRISRYKKNTGSDFLRLRGEALIRFNKIAQKIAHSSRSVVFKEGGPAAGIYVIGSGRVKLFATSSDGRTMILRIARRGDVLGLSATLNDLPYEATAETLSPCEFRYLGQYPFLSFLDAHVEAACTAALILAKEQREFVLVVGRLMLARSTGGRIAQLLVDFANAEGSREPALRFPMVLNHAELASMAGTSRETVTRTLNRFELDGIILRADSRITILQPSRLKQLAH